MFSKHWCDHLFNGMSCYDNQRIYIALFSNATNEHIMLINIKYVYAVYETFLCNFYAKLLIVHYSATIVPQIFLKFPNVILKMQKRNLYSKSCVINQIFQILYRKNTANLIIQRNVEHFRGCQGLRCVWNLKYFAFEVADYVVKIDNKRYLDLSICNSAVILFPDPSLDYKTSKHFL